MELEAGQYLSLILLPQTPETLVKRQNKRFLSRTESQHRTMVHTASDRTNPPWERHSEIVDDVQPDPKGLGEKLISIPARPTHGLYSHALVQALKSLPAQCAPLIIS